MFSPLATSEALADELRRLGVRAGDTLMVHASLRAVGPVDGGADAVVAALDAAVGADGTVMMVLGAFDEFAWVNTRPEEERPALLAGTPPFDCLRTPADPDVGVLAEVFRRSAGTHVSDHPEGRFGARGRLAPALVSDVPWHDYYGPGSPLERLRAAGGRVLRLGADTNTVTLLHYAEYLADVPDKRRVRRHRVVYGPAGPCVRHVDGLDDSDGIVAFAGDDYFSVVLTSYLDVCSPPRGRVGTAHAELLDAADLVAFAERWMSRHLG